MARAVQAARQALRLSALRQLGSVTLVPSVVRAVELVRLISISWVATGPIAFSSVAAGLPVPLVEVGSQAFQTLAEAEAEET